MVAESELHFGPFQLHEQTGQLFRDGLPMHMQPKPFALLSHLLRNRHRFVSKEELLAIVWPGVSVSNFALFSALRDLRRVLGDTDSAERMIRTARGRGIRFAARVVQVNRPRSPVREARTDAPTGSCHGDRHEPLALLLKSLAEARAGQLRASFVSGAAGAGKTHLVSELTRRALSDGVPVHSTRCIEGAAPPAWAWCEQELAARRPSLRVMEDLHLADDASLALLERLVVAAEREPIHLVLTFRDPPRPNRALARLLAAAAREACTERIELRGLHRATVARMLEDAIGSEPAASVVERLLSATSGNALFVTELVKLASSGELDLTALPGKLTVPLRVRDTLRGQLDGLSAPAQRVLHVLSASEGLLPLAALARVLGESVEAVLDALSDAEAAGIAITADPAAGIALEHELVRESILRDLTVTARARLQHSIAQARSFSRATQFSAVQAYS